MSDVTKKIQEIKRLLKRWEDEHQRLYAQINEGYRRLGELRALDNIFQSAAGKETLTLKENSLPALPRGAITRATLDVLKQNFQNGATKEELAKAVSQQLDQKVSVSAVYVALKRAANKGEIYHSLIKDLWVPQQRHQTSRVNPLEPEDISEDIPF